MNCILTAQLPKEILLLLKGISHRKLLMIHKLHCKGWQELVLLSQLYQNISFRIFHLSSTKCQNPMKFQTEKANIGCTPEFSKVLHLFLADTANIPPDKLFSVNFLINIEAPD